MMVDRQSHILLLSSMFYDSIAQHVCGLLVLFCCQSNGRALLMLLPSEEEGVLATLKPKNIPIKKLTINPEKVSAD